LRNDISFVRASRQPLYYMPDTRALPLARYEEPSSTIHHLLHGIRILGLLFNFYAAAVAMAEHIGVLIAKTFFDCCFMDLNP
jgi:hypothetical protein